MKKRTKKVWYEENVLENQRDRNMSDEEKSFESKCFYDGILDGLLVKSNEFMKQLEEKGCISMETSRIMQMKEAEQMIIPFVTFFQNVNKPLRPITGTLQSTAILNTEDGPLYALEDYLVNVTNPRMDWIPGTFNSPSNLIEVIQSTMDNWNKRSAVEPATSPATPTNTFCEDGHSSHYFGLRVADAGPFFPLIDVKQGIEATCIFRLCNENIEEHLLPPIDTVTSRYMLQTS